MFGGFQAQGEQTQRQSFVRGFDNEFYAPHSRFQEVRAEDIKKVKELEILCDSKEAGVYIVFTKGGRRIL